MNRDSTWLKKFNNEGNWTDFYFTNYVFGKKIFVILSTCCVHQGVHNVLLVKVRAMVQDLYNLIILSGSNNSNLVSRPHTPRSSYFLRFDHFVVFNLGLWRK